MFKNIFAGMLIGLANIIPGVSGGIIAMSMGIYDKLIHCVNHFFSDFKNNVVFLAPLALGMGIAIAASVFGIDYFFETFPVQTNLLFIGLIMGSLPSIYGKVSHSAIKPGYIVLAVVFFVAVVGMALLNGTSGHEIVVKASFSQIISLFIIGLIASVTIVVPGVSGSMILMLLGYYNPILDTIKEFIVAFLHFDINAMLGTLFVLVPFGIGLVIGIVAIAKIIEIMFERFPMYVYWSIIGLLIASPIGIIMVGNFPELTIVRILTGLVTFTIGWIISVNLGDEK